MQDLHCLEEPLSTEARGPSFDLVIYVPDDDVKDELYKNYKMRPELPDKVQDAWLFAFDNDYYYFRDDGSRWRLCYYCLKTLCLRNPTWFVSLNGWIVQHGYRLLRPKKWEEAENLSWGEYQDVQDQQRSV